MTERPVRPADLERARVWLVGHGLNDARPTPLLAARLAVRSGSRLASGVLLAAFIIAVALVYSVARSPGAVDGPGAYRHWPLLVLTAVVAGLVLAQSLLDRRVRRADRRLGATLPRRAAHPVRPGWRTVVGVPRAVFAAATFAGTLVLAIGALTTLDSTARYAALVLIVGLCGVAFGTAVQLRHVLTHPVVADDEVSLATDVIMRVEDARHVTTPTVVWCLPAASVLDAVPRWWIIAWCLFVALGAVTLALITVGTALAARRRGTPLAPR
ncbi:hypothetical protein [Streptomyces sp. WMMB 322]|uniref:hypothetical protein n=1 Tax=Streptomyces sp. WMMB 322 TaxID=1286821 RepID=UPI0006E32654|nr:hypothetical protein [Streptomyces sp. WMMB 322]SCK37655.1 hypothetical protein H180DRAFT_03162 [Streptomyces sp. WMMB 322]